MNAFGTGLSPSPTFTSHHCRPLASPLETVLKVGQLSARAGWEDTTITDRHPHNVAMARRAASTGALAAGAACSLIADGIIWANRGRTALAVCGPLSCCRVSRKTRIVCSLFCSSALQHAVWVSGRRIQVCITSYHHGPTYPAAGAKTARSHLCDTFEGVGWDQLLPRGAFADEPGEPRGPAEGCKGRDGTIARA
mmetsp:Transcript_1489/g.4836  ORF Transcript_1489/g.4836 Transcript_1489/m.4836 type:complete len:195 (-) Transcript_1489:3762-4346(-)